MIAKRICLLTVKLFLPVRFLAFGFLALIFAPFSLAQTAEDYQWDSLAIGGGGFVSAIIPSTTEQNLFYARTDVGGAYRWDNDNSRWIPLNDWVSDDETGYLGVESLATDPQAPNKLYMLVGISYFNNGKTAILRSDDYGQTFSEVDVSAQFKAHGNGIGRQNGEKLQVDPNNSDVLYTGTRWNGVFKSTNAGVTWSRLDGLAVTTTPNENGVSFVVLDGGSVSAGETQTMFVGISRFTSVGANLYRSDDAGQTFTPIANAPIANMPQRAVLAADGHLYITYGNGAGPHGHWDQPEPMDAGQIWKYNTDTGAWANVTPSGFTRAFGGISVDPNNAQRLVASSVNTYMQQYDSAYGDRIFLSTNGGTTWTDVVARGFSLDSNGVSWINGHAIHWAGSIEFDPFNTNAVWVTSGNGIFRNAAIDSSDTWTFTVAGLEETVPLGIVSIPDGPLVSVIGDYDGFRHTDIAQYAPIHTPRMGTTTGLDFAAQDTNTLVRSGGGNNPAMYYSLDMGTTWTKTGVMNGTNGQVAIAADGSAILHSPQDSTTSYRSLDLGNSWTAITGLAINNTRIVADPVNSNKFYAYNNGTMMVSTNGGISFSAAGSLAANGSKVIRVAPGHEGDIWVPLNNAGLSRSTDSGNSFSTVAGVTYAGAVGFGKAAEGSNYPTIYLWGTVNGVRGIYRSKDTGASWVRVNDDAHQYGGPGNGQFVIGDMNTYGVVYMSTAGRGIAYGMPVAEGSSSSSSSSEASSSASSSPASSSASSSSEAMPSSSSSSSESLASSSSVAQSSSSVATGGGSSGGGSVPWYTLVLLGLLMRQRKNTCPN